MRSTVTLHVVSSLDSFIAKKDNRVSWMDSSDHVYERGVTNDGAEVIQSIEAWKHPDKKDYFFGAHDDNRLQFTVGRDIRLDPPQQGDPLNYFIYPYAEQDGKPFAVKSKFSFQDRLSNGD